MNKPYFPNEQHLQIRWSDLENAWRMLAAPDKQLQIEETLQAVRTLSLSVGPQKTVFTVIAATAWLTDDGPVSKDNWQP